MVSTEVRASSCLGRWKEGQAGVRDLAKLMTTFLGVSSVLLQNWANMGFSVGPVFCDPQLRILKGLDFWVYHFYLSKYVEFIDSFVLVLKGKKLLPPENSQFFLHVFHHTVTASIVWVTFYRHVTIGWTGPLTNSFVHTIMYGYYGLVEIFEFIRPYGVRIVTPIQIVQFIFCLLALAYEAVNRESCGSDPTAMLWLAFTYSVFLAFFIKVFFTKSSGGRRGKNGSSNGSTTGNGKDEAPKKNGNGEVKHKKVE